MAKKKLILIPSDKMDSNRKPDRNENGLVRMAKVARDSMGFDSSVELYPETKAADKRLKGAMMLDIFHAFSEDIKAAKAAGLTPEEMRRVGFVTTKTFNKITGSKSDKPKKNIWITDDITDTIIGADPEFILFDNDERIIKANNIMGKEGQIGSDGAMAELRPSPAVTPEGLTENIRSLFNNKQLTGKIKDYKWVAGCYFKDDHRDYPIGGHIHIGNPMQIARIDMDRRLDFFKSFNKILDERLALPMIKIDGADLGRARRTECVIGKYGYFGEWRQCNGRLEHRTLSGMWLMHPKLATLVFGVAKAIIDEVYRRVADRDFNLSYMFPAKYKGANIWSPSFESWQSIPLVKDMGCTRSSRKMIELLHESSASKITARFLNEWHRHMKDLSTYNKYSKYIDGLREVLKNNTKSFHESNRNLKKTWVEGAKFLG